MNVEKNQISEPTDNKCKSCKVFYAAETFEGFCSACFKYFHLLAQKTAWRQKRRTPHEANNSNDIKNSIC